MTVLIFYASDEGGRERRETIIMMNYVLTYELILILIPSSANFQPQFIARSYNGDGLEMQEYSIQVSARLDLSSEDMQNQIFVVRFSGPFGDAGLYPTDMRIRLAPLR